MSSGIWTLFSMGAFVAIVIWVYLIKNGKDFDAQANMPLDDEARELSNMNKENSA